MAIKTPQEYIESLKDGRVVYCNGEKVNDVTEHPILTVDLHGFKYDWQYTHGRPAAHPPCPSTVGKRIHLLQKCYFKTYAFSHGAWTKRVQREALAHARIYIGRFYP